MTPRHFEDVFEHVAVRVFEVDKNYVRVDFGDAPKNLIGLAQNGDAHIACSAEAVLDDRGADTIFIDDQYVKRLLADADIFIALHKRKRSVAGMLVVARASSVGRCTSRLRTGRKEVDKCYRC